VCSRCVRPDAVFVGDWQVRYCRLDPAALAAHPLLPLALDTLGSAAAVPEGVTEGSVDLVVEVLRRYDSRAEHMPLVQLLVHKVMALEARYVAAVAAGDEDTERGLTRVFTEMAEAYTDLLLAPVEMNQLAVVRLVLLCTSSEDTDTAEITLRFW